MGRKPAQVEEISLDDIEEIPLEETSGMDMAFNALDLERAPVSAMLAKALGLERPTDPTSEELATLKRSYPTSSELMKRAGILEEDPLYSRSILGLIGDVASTPTTYTSLMAGPIAKGFTRVFSPVSALSELGLDKLGKRMWRGSFSKMDAAALKAGKKKVPSDLLMKDNIYGLTAKSVGKQIDASQAGRMAERNAILDLGIAPGKQADIDLVLSPMEEHGRKLMESIQPEVREKGASILREVESMKESVLGTPDKIIPPGKETVIKGSQDLATGAYSPNTIIPGSSSRVIPGKPSKNMTPWEFQKEKVLARDSLSQADFINKTKMAQEADLLKSYGFQKEAERLSQNPESIARLNEEWGAIHSGQKAKMSDITKEMTAPPVDMKDMATIAAYGALTGKASPWMLARQAGDIGSLMGLLGTTGAMAHKLGTSAVPKTIKRTLTRTPWSLRTNEDLEEMPIEEVQ